MSRAEPTVDVLDTGPTDRRFQEAIIELFSGDGTVYLVSGYFTYQGYLGIRDAIVSFLERSPENELVAIVGAASDQFSARIAQDLWSLEQSDRVRLYKYSRGLHAKLYLRDGPDPQCIVGSSNLTQVAFSYNVELNVEFARDHRDHPDMKALFDWIDDMLAASEPLARRDVHLPVLVGGSIVNWSNKAQLLPVRTILLRVIPVIVLLVVLAGLVRFV